MVFSSPVSVYLSSEWVGLYGKPVLSVALKNRVKVVVSQGDGVKPKDWEIVDRVLKNVLQNKTSYKVKAKKGEGLVDFLDIKPAVYVSGVAALLKFFNGEFSSKEEVNNLAYKIEKKISRLALGVGISTSCFGGLIFYRKEFEFLKLVSRLPFKIPVKIEERLYIVKLDCKSPSLQEVFKAFGKGLNSNPEKFRKIMEESERIVRRMVVSIVKEDLDFFAKCVGDEQRLIEEAGLLPKEIEKKLSVLKKSGKARIVFGESGPYALFVDVKGKGGEILSKQGFSYVKFKADYQGLVEM